ISAAAIASAERHFAHPAIRFLQGNAEQAAALLADEPAFDLIACFETVEHVADPAALLQALRRLCAPGGTIVVSCPNDPATLSPGATNPFHVRTYTFGQFREFAEGILGPASDWLIETPAIGLLHYRLGDAATERPASGPTDIVRLHDAEACLQVPAQQGDAPSAQDCLAYLGVWGDTLPGNCAVSPMSHSGFMFPWRKLDRLELEFARVNREQQEDRRQLLNFAETVTALRQSHAADQEQIGQFGQPEGQAASLAEENQPALRRYAAGRAAAEADLARTRAELAARDTELMLARQWREGVERSPFYRVLQAYVGLFRLPVVGPVLTAARRGAAQIWRGSRQT
ncbi:MAG TPA: methyltransferase domain-containing protein, partial [Acetobacteraceae bacterium]|nr:methyltransferase domain-containing protein [Acetobacteraceae bacterium]